MKRFFIYIISVLLPLLLFGGVLELITGIIPNSYSYKYNYVKTHGDRIEVLAIGHSQLYDGIKPKSFDLPSFNLCNSAQDYTDDYYLFRELLPYMPKLRVVIMPIGYDDVTTITNDSNLSLSDRSCYYHKYMNLDYDGQVPVKYRFECLDPLRASKKIFKYYILNSDIVGCDSLGRRSTHYLRNKKHKLGYEKFIERYTLKEFDYKKLRLNKEKHLLLIIDMLKKKNISLLLVSPPFYWNCGFSDINVVQMRFIKDYIANLCKKYSVQYINMDNMDKDTTFTYDDFYDEAHLSELGAEKFTSVLNNCIFDSLRNSR